MRAWPMLIPILVVLTLGCVPKVPQAKGPDDEAIPIDVQSEMLWTEYIVATDHRFIGSETVVDRAIFDRTRPDIRTRNFVYEVDWSNKWQEGVGQACYYAEALSRQGVVILLFDEGIKTERDRQSALRCLVACRRANLDLLLYDCAKKSFVE